MAECQIQDWKHTSTPESVSRHEASIARTRQRAESEFLRWWMPKYCPLVPASRTIIATAFSPNGRVLASTHGDHTVKIIDCQTGKCLKVLLGHQRTPWVVRFHPQRSDILASGSLDCEVRLWDAKTSCCTGVLSFYKPVPSIAFHATGELLAVASGRKLFIWDYNNQCETLEPPIILRTRRSLRAVQFHPHGAPYLLTAEVHNLDSEGSAMTPALLSNYSFRDTPLLSVPGLDNLISELSYMHNFEQVGASSSIPVTTGSFYGSRLHGTSSHHLMTSLPGVASSLLGTHTAGAEVPAVSLNVGSEQTTSLLGGDTELPCMVKLRIWRHSIKNPFIALEPQACLLAVSHAVLCSEMGTHFSPCGRFLVACVACVLPQRDGDHGSQLHEHYDSTGAGTSPTRHALPSRQIIYELRVYSLEDATFGAVLASRAIKAAHCLTSIQFSPTSEHILLAYGRQHSSLLRTVFFDGDTRVPMYTVLEVYRVSDMELARVLLVLARKSTLHVFILPRDQVLFMGLSKGSLGFFNTMAQYLLVGKNIHEIYMHVL